MEIIRSLTSYALLAGRAGGQNLSGGTGASATLTLQSTANATKGKILFGTSAYDEVNNRLGIGTATPGQALVVNTSGNVAVTIGTTGTSGQTATLNLVSGFSGVSGDASISANIAELRLNAGTVGGTNRCISFYLGGTETVRIASTGYLGIGTTAPSAVLHLKAGTATANTAPLKFTTGTLLTTPEAGVTEYNNTPWFTNSDAVRRSIVLSSGTFTGGAVAVGGTVQVNINGTNYNMLVQ